MHSQYVSPTVVFNARADAYSLVEMSINSAPLLMRTEDTLHYIQRSLIDLFVTRGLDIPSQHTLDTVTTYAYIHGADTNPELLDTLVECVHSSYIGDAYDYLNSGDV